MLGLIFLSKEGLMFAEEEDIEAEIEMAPDFTFGPTAGTEKKEIYNSGIFFIMRFHQKVTPEASMTLNEYQFILSKSILNCFA